MPERSHEARIDLWREPSGYWSASVRVQVVGMADWDASATSFQDSDEAIEWGREQANLAWLPPKETP